MKKTIIATALLLSLGVVGCQGGSSERQTNIEQSSWTQASLNQFANELKVTYRVVTNIPEQACSADQKTNVALSQKSIFQLLLITLMVTGPFFIAK